ncbi:hypothetical protein F5Y09DRAFT_295069 [Xylaria sp. FL1042]|nr:hypothetical protein F5Y09DRAFT_295069 [Xylaria sp. FL1042]
MRTQPVSSLAVGLVIVVVVVVKGSARCLQPPLFIYHYRVLHYIDTCPLLHYSRLQMRSACTAYLVHYCNTNDSKPRRPPLLQVV